MARHGFLLLMVVAAAGRAATLQVSIVDSRFVPDTAVVTVGDTVTWTNNGIFPHTSTSGVNGVYDSLWNSGTLSNGGTFSHAFTSVGSFHYFCRLHYLSGMVGLVQVNAGGVEEQRMPVTQPSLRASPNPFRDHVTICLNGVSSAVTAVTIADAAGRAVRSLCDRGHASSLVWDGRDGSGRRVDAGVYFVTGDGLSGSALRVLKVD